MIVLARFVLMVFIAALPPVCLAEVKLPPLFTDHMVVQRNQPISIFGTAEPGEKVRVELNHKKASTQAGQDGKWRVALKSLKAGGPYVLVVQGQNKIEIHDVLVGEVWIGSGQSNMELPMTRVRDAEKEIAAAHHPQLRMFTVQRAASDQPTPQFSGTWEVSSPETAAKFSAVGYFFGREMNEKLNVPVGIIHSSWGGTPAEAWTSKEYLHKDAALGVAADKQLTELRNLRSWQQQFVVDLAKWERDYAANGKPIQDTGNEGFAKGWASPGCDLSEWKSVMLPSMAQTLGWKSGGSLWIRKDIALTNVTDKSAVTLSLGPLQEFVTIYWNGVQISTSGTDPLKISNVNRTYPIPANLLKTGKNTIAVRLFFHTPQTGRIGMGSQMYVMEDQRRQSLDGPWLMKPEYEFPPLSAEAVKAFPKFQIQASPQSVATELFNAMIYPLSPYGIRGFLWYQGEANAVRGSEYARLLPLLIDCWRNLWQKDDLPFYFVQLPNFGTARMDPGESNWAELRESQFLTQKNVPNTGMAIAIDIGEAGNIHPQNKQDIGHRLALIALAKTYGRKLEYSGPLYDSMTVEGNAIRIRFTHVDRGLVANCPTVRQFAIAGEDRRFIWADTTIEKDSILVRNRQVMKPAAVRYAWADDPEGCFVFNSANLPASPFRTDQWPRPDTRNLRTGVH